MPQDESLFSFNGKRVILSQPLISELQCPNIGQFFANLRLLDHKSNRKRFLWFSWLRHPAVVFLVSSYVVIRGIVINFILPRRLSREQIKWMQYAGDLSLTINLRYLYNVFLSTYSFGNFLYLWFHYCASRAQTKPITQSITRQDIAPFQLLLGKVSPKDIGFRNPSFCASFVRQAHFFTRWCPMVQKSTLISILVCFINIVGLRAVQQNLLEPLDMLASVGTVFIATHQCEFFLTATIYHMLYLALLCKYLRLKLQQLTLELKLRAPREPIRLIRTTTRVVSDLHKLIWEVQCFNKYFWSRILFTLVGCFVLNSSILFYILIFADVILLVRLFGYAILATEIIVFGLLLHSVSRVHLIGKRLYVKLHEYHAKNYAITNGTKMVYISRISLGTKLKHILLQFKPKKFVFTCGSFFSINYRVFIEIAFIMAIIFMKLLQFKFQSKVWDGSA